MEIGSSAIIAQQLAAQRQQRFSTEEQNSSIQQLKLEGDAVKTQLTRAVKESDQEDQIRKEPSKEALELAANGNIDFLNDNAETGGVLDIIA